MYTVSFLISPSLWHSGCLSGRGQAEGEEGRPDRTLVQQMEEHYSSLPVRLPDTNPEVQRLYQDWLDGHDSPHAQQCLHTQYKNHTQPPSQTLNSDIQWWFEVIHWCVPTYLEPSLALKAPIKTDCLMLSWAHTDCNVSAAKEKLNRGRNRLPVLCTELDSALLMRKFAFVN